MVSTTCWTAFGGHDDLDLDLGHEIDLVLGAAIRFGVSLLAAEAADLGDRHALDALVGQGVLDVLDLEMPDDRFDLFHGSYARCAVGSDENIAFFAVLAQVQAFDFRLRRDPQSHR